MTERELAELEKEYFESLGGTPTVNKENKVACNNVLCKNCMFDKEDGCISATDKKERERLLTQWKEGKKMEKWRCIELNGTLGFTVGKVYEVGQDGTIKYDSGRESSRRLKNGKCWNAVFEKVEEQKEEPKFKKGDKVLIARRSSGWNNSGMMDKWLGETVTPIKEFGNEGLWKIEEDETENGGTGWLWNEKCFDKAEKKEPPKSIHITQDGRNVVAVLKNGKQTEKRTLAQCNPTDEFVFEIGARLAFERLVGDEKKEWVPKVGDRVVGVKEYCGRNTVGKLGTIKDTGTHLSVEFDENINGHDCRGIAKDGHGWNLPKDCIKPTETTDLSSVSTDNLLAELKNRIK